MEEDEQGAGGQPAITSSEEAASSVAGATAGTFGREFSDHLNSSLPNHLAPIPKIKIGAMTPQMQKAVIKYGMALIFSAIGVSGSVVSMVRLEPSGWLITIVIAVFFCMLAVLFEDRLESFSLRDLTAKLREVQGIAESAKSIAKDSASLAVEVAAASARSSYYGSSSSSGGEDSEGSSSWEDVEDSAACLRKKIKEAEQAAPHNGA